jgi:hypothetical protein
MTLKMPPLSTIAYLNFMSYGKSGPPWSMAIVQFMSFNFNIKVQVVFVFRMMVLGTVPSYGRSMVGIAGDRTTLAKWVGPTSS